MKRPNVWFALLCLCLPVLPLRAQDAPAPTTPSKTAKPKVKATPPKTTAKSKTANLKIGTLTEIDADNSTVSLNEKTATNTYTLTEKTRFRKNQREVELSAFKVGEQAVIKLRKVRGKEEYVAQEMHDSQSWEWMDAIRHKPTQATITAIEDTTLQVTIGTNAIPFEFTVSDKTHWSKGGKDALPTDFKTGETVTIVPRGLPSGNVMASIVADSVQEATRTKERHARSVAGQITALDGGKWRIVLATNAQDSREFAYSPKTLVSMSSRPVTVAALKVGQKIRASLKQTDDDLPEAYRITIETKKTAAVKTPSAAASRTDLKGVSPIKK